MPTLNNAVNTIAATKANQQTGTSTAVYVSPGTQQYHASAAQAWINFKGTATQAIIASYNVASLTDNSTGNYTVAFTVGFATANYAVVASNILNSNSDTGTVTLSRTYATGSVGIISGTPGIFTSTAFGFTDVVNIFSAFHGAQ